MVACWSAKREATGWPLQMVKRWKQLSTSFQQQIARKMLNYMVNGFKQFVKMSVCLGYVMVYVAICSDTTRPPSLFCQLIFTTSGAGSMHQEKVLYHQFFLFPQRKVPLAENFFLLDMMNPVRRNTRMKKARMDIVLNQNEIQMSYVRTCTTYSS